MVVVAEKNSAFDLSSVRHYLKEDERAVFSIVELIDPKVRGGKHQNPVTHRCNPPIKAMAYVLLFGALERSVKTSCHQIGAAFLASDFDNGRPTLPMVLSVMDREAVDSLELDEDLFRKASKYLKHEFGPEEEFQLRELVHSGEEFWYGARNRGETSFDPGFDDFFSVATLRAYSKFFKLDFDNLLSSLDAKFSSDGVDWIGTLDAVRRIRNRVAHGERPANEVGRLISPNQLREDSKNYFRFIRGWLSELESIYSLQSSYYCK